MSRKVRAELDTTSTGTDELVHIFCGNCYKIAMARGWKPRTFCGAYGESDGHGASSEDLHCIVCSENAKQPCTVCGYKPLVLY